MMLVAVISHVTMILLYLHIRFLPRLSGLVTIFLLLSTFFELITGYELQSTHAESWSTFTLALNTSLLNFFNPFFIMSWHFLLLVLLAHSQICTAADILA